MKISLRLTILTVIALFVGATVLALGVISYRHARFTADHLSQQLLEQAMGRIESQIENLLRQATTLNALAEQRLKSGQIQADDFGAFARYAVDAIEHRREMSGFFIGLEATGEAVGVSHLRARPSIWQSKRGVLPAAYEVHQFWPDLYPERPFAVDAEKPGLDIRASPWYVQAQRARRSIWTDVSLFLGVEGVKDVHGMTYATPIYSLKNWRTRRTPSSGFSSGRSQSSIRSSAKSTTSPWQLKR